MISNLWTLGPDPEPGGATGPVRPLSAIATAASYTRLNQAPASLQLTLAPGVDPTAYPWDTRWILRRGGEVFLRGRIAKPPTSQESPDDEGASLELLDLWHDLATTDYTQEWDHAPDRATTAKVRTGHARLGLDPVTGKRQTTIAALASITKAAQAAGIPLVIVHEGLAEIRPAPIDARNRKIADIIRALLRWHPTAVAWIETAEQGGNLVDILRIVDRGATPAEVIPITDLANLGSHTARPDLVPDSVHIHYEAEGPRDQDIPPGDGADEDDEALVRTSRVLRVHSDVWPPGSPLTRKSLVVTLPAPAAGGGDPPAPPAPHRVPIQTRPLPPTGSTDEKAEKWWLDHLGLTELGLKTSDVRLPTSTTGEDTDDEIRAHRVRFAWAADDDPLNDPERPNPINPNSEPLWRPPDVADLPRELVSGQLAEWMKVKASEVVVDATVAIRAATVDALPPRSRRVVMNLQPRSGDVKGVPAYLIDREVRVTATTAKTKVYKNWPSTGSGDSPAPSEDPDDAIVPDLARRMWESRQAIGWDGSITFEDEEAGAARWLGRRIAIADPQRPTWADISGMVQRERLGLDAGSTDLDVDAPLHLSEHDWADLHTAARDAAKAASDIGNSPSPPRSPGAEDEDDEDGEGGVFPGTVGPVSGSTSWGGGEAPKQWQLRHHTEAGGPRRSQIRTGTLSGIGLNGYPFGWLPDTWVDVPTDKAVWLKVEVEIAGAQLTYHVSPSETETIYLPDRVDSTEVSLEYLALTESPEGTSPTINPSTGEADVTGVYWFLIGNTRDSGVTNHYTGPLSLGWCPPDTAHLVALT